jgi:biopolymer transport protein TolR
MAHARIRRKPMAQINVVPYIDVMLVLLVIFMVTAPLLTQGVQVELPQVDAKAVADAQNEPVVVSIRRDGSYHLNIGGDSSQALDGKEIQARVAAVLRLRPAAPVLVRGDHKVDYGKVVEVMALLQRSGVENVGLVTDQPGRR